MDSPLLVVAVGALSVFTIKNLYDNKEVNWMYDKQTKLENVRGFRHANFGLEHLFSHLLPAIEPRRWTTTDHYYNKMKANMMAFDMTNPTNHEIGIEDRIRFGYIRNQATGPRNAIYRQF